MISDDPLLQFKSNNCPFRQEVQIPGLNSIIVKLARTKYKLSIENWPRERRILSRYVDSVFKDFELYFADVSLEILLKQKLYSGTRVLRTCYGITFQLGSREIVLQMELIKGVYGYHHLILVNFTKDPLKCRQATINFAGNRMEAEFKEYALSVEARRAILFL